MVSGRVIAAGVAALLVVSMGWAAVARSSAGSTVLDGTGGGGGGPNNVVGNPHRVESPESVPAVMAAAQRAVEAFNAAGSVAHGLVHVTEASTQVVAGTKYALRLELAPVTACPAGDVTSPSCTFDNTQAVIVTVTVWHRPWLHNKDAANEWVVTLVSTVRK